MIYYVTGGERSGKSKYAQNLVWDEDHQKRVDRHKDDRNKQWIAVEEEKYISSVINEHEVVVIDCITLWLTNYFVDTKNDIIESLRLTKEELKKVFAINAHIIIISNEIGMGVHAQTEIGRKFTELQGWINQFIAENADTATVMFSGLPLKLK